MADGFVHTVHRDGRWRNSVEGDQAPLADSSDSKADAVEAGHTEARRRQTDPSETVQAELAAMNKWLTDASFVESTDSRRDV